MSCCGLTHKQKMLSVVTHTHNTNCKKIYSEVQTDKSYKIAFSNSSTNTVHETHNFSS